MAAKRSVAGKSRRLQLVHPEFGSFMADWLALSPAERLRRSWRLRRRLPSLKKIHDAKLFPKP